VEIDVGVEPRGRLFWMGTSEGGGAELIEGVAMVIAAGAGPAWVVAVEGEVEEGGRRSMRRGGRLPARMLRPLKDKMPGGSTARFKRRSPGDEMDRLRHGCRLREVCLYVGECNS